MGASLSAVRARTPRVDTPVRRVAGVGVAAGVKDVSERMEWARLARWVVRGRDIVVGFGWGGCRSGCVDEEGGGSYMIWEGRRE